MFLISSPLSCFVVATCIAGWPLATSASVNDVTTSVQQLGNAVNSIYPGQGLSCAQDLQLFGGKIFLGYGNLDNRASKSVLYLDPTDRLFKIDSPTIKLDDEILRRFRVFGSEMYVESFDPISSLSNLYLRRSGNWSIRGMSFSGSGRHNFDIYKFSNILFTGGGAGFPGIAMSLNSGTNWILPGASITHSVFYDGEFFEFGGKLYVSQDLSYSRLVPTLTAPFLLRYTGSTNTPFSTVCAQPSSFYPSGDLNEGKITHFQTLRGKGIFIGDGGLYSAASISTPALSKVTLPNQVGDLAVDLIARTNGVYYLACVPQPPGSEFPYFGVIGKSENLQTWVEICRFGASETVQSLEIVNGDFYVGLGSYLTTANPHSGDVLLIPRTNANEERSMVAPGHLEFANGRAGNTFPFSVGKSVRFQQVYTNTAFANVSGPQLITHMAFRPTAFGGQAFTTTVQNVRMTLSTTAASPLKGLSSTFAANVGSDVATVYSGSLRLASTYSGPSAGPKDFDVEIPLQNPFYYDPARGNLLLDIQNVSGSISTPLDVTWGSGLPCSRMVSAAGGVANSTGLADASPTCLITKFKMRPAQLTNRAPLIFARFGETITLPNLAPLSGSVQDDGLPNPPHLLTSLWTKLSGPGNVVFGNPHALATTAAFSTSGAYVLRLTAADGALSASSDVYYNVLPVPPLNLAPVVSAGPNQIISCTNLATAKPNSVQLNGVIADDGHPQVPGITTSLWSKVSGPGTVAFAATTAPLTSATFSLPGAYVLRLTANDGLLSATSDVTISVATTTTANQSPSVNAGPELTATQLAPVSLKGQVTDDGLPASPPALSLAWTKVSGPGSVQFDSPANSVTTATFSLPGDYALRLSASDGSAQASSQTTVHVLNGQFVVVPNTLTNSNGRSGNSYPFNIGNSVRYQQVYLASQFPATGGPFLISAIAFRPSAFSGAAFTSSVPNLVVDLATTAASPGSGLSATFADNVGSDKQTVFSGPLTLSSKFTGPGPKAFDVIIPLQRAFSYEPSSGNLLLDIRLPSPLHTTDLDCTWGTGIPTSRLVSRPGGVDDPQGSGDATPTALVTQFTLSSLPSPKITVKAKQNSIAIKFESVFGQAFIMATSTNLVDWTVMQTYLPLYRSLDVAEGIDTAPLRFFRAYIAGPAGAE